MVHASIFLTYFYEHFSIIDPVPRNFLALAQQSRAERWYGASNDASWYEACNIAANFTLRSYNSASPGVVGMG